MTDLNNGKAWNGMRNKLCTNIPHAQKTTLYVFQIAEDMTSGWKSYDDGDVIRLSYREDFRYRFCLAQKKD